VIQGSHRDMQALPGYVYNVPTKEPYYLPVYENGAWSYRPCVGRVLDRNRVEGWKTKFYEFEGWNSNSGWPKRSTLESMGLKKVADTLQNKGRLG